MRKETFTAYAGAGCLYWHIIDPVTGQAGPRQGPIEISAVELGKETETENMTSRCHARYGQVLYTLATPGAVTMNFTLHEINDTVLEFIASGRAVAYSQTAGTWNDEPLEVAELDSFINLPDNKQRINRTGFDVKSEDGLTTYTPGTHYIVNHNMGWIKFLSAAGGPAKDDMVSITGGYGEISGVEIAGGTVDQFHVEIEYDGKNRIDGHYYQIHAPRALITISSTLDLNADTFAEIGATATFEAKEGYDAPYYMRRIAA